MLNRREVHLNEEQLNEALDQFFSCPALRWGPYNERRNSENRNVDFACTLILIRTVGSVCRDTDCSRFLSPTQEMSLPSIEECKSACSFVRFRSPAIEQGGEKLV